MILSNAKINLSLAVINQHVGKYHKLLSIVLPINIYDIITIIETDKWSFDCNDKKLLKDNIIYKVISHLSSITDKKYHIDLQKNIPIMSGFGGGSSNAVAVLQEIYKKNSIKIDTNELCKIAKTFGSDCSFFVHNTPSIISGTGDIVYPLNKKTIKNLQQYHLIVFKPPFSLKTEAVYHKLSTKYSNLYFSISQAKDLTQRLIQSIDNFDEDLPIFNTFSSIVFSEYKALMILKEKLESFDIQIMLTGSGSGCFCIAKNRSKIKHAEEIIRSFFKEEIFLQHVKVI